MKPAHRIAMVKMRRLANQISKVFNIPYKRLEEESPGIRDFGSCLPDKTIRLRLHNLRTGRLLKLSTIIDTLCHELAHAGTWESPPHSKEFKQLHAAIKVWLARQ